MIRRIQTIDAHAAGEPLRLIVSGFPSPEGRTMLQKREWLRRHADHLRRALMLEPRGHADMYGAVLTEPATAGADAGVLFMHNEGYSTMCGHGVLAVVTIAFERHLLMPRDAGGAVLLDSPAGLIRARAQVTSPATLPVTGTHHAQSDCRVTEVSFVNVPSFVLHAGLRVRAGGRDLPVDVAFGGAFYVLVDSEAAGVPLDAAHLPELRRLGMEIKRGVEAAQSIVHPAEPDLKGIYGTIFTAPARLPDADLRNVTIFADAEVDRSPCGTGTSAVMAVLDAMGLLSDDRPFTHESLIGTTFRGRVVERTTVGDHPAIVPEISGSAWITGEHTFLIDADDPLSAGFRI
ncbi:MAG TPA: proline racemase family protein [Vicinamibacterales bacterium]|nr:proline racemase family protein [Vicinamibacterales bacterium]